MCDILKEVYSSVLDEVFDYDNFHKRVKLQKIVYILENMGVHIGNYSFSWDKHGPYSIALDDDAYRCSKKTVERPINFTQQATHAFNQVKCYMAERESYEDYDWLECISSLHYLKYVLHKLDDKGTLNALKTCKPHLNNDQENTKAMQIANIIEQGADYVQEQENKGI